MRLFPLFLILFAGTAARLALFAFLPSSTLRKLETRVELASPSTSFKSLSEAIYLLRLQQASADGKHRGGEEVIQSPSPWQSGHVHHSPLIVHALSPFIETQETVQIASLAKERARKEKDKFRKAADERRLRQMRQSQHPDSIDAPRNPLSQLQLLLSRHSTRLKPHHYLWALVDLLAAACLALIEAQRASWRTKYARIRGAREVELELLAQHREASEKTSGARLAKGRKEKESREQSSVEMRASDRSAKAAALYLFNPLSLLSNLALSSISVYNLLTLLSVLLAVTLGHSSRSGTAARRKSQGAGGSFSISSLVLLAVFAGAVSVNIIASLYPLLLLPPLLLLATNQQSSAPSSSSRSVPLSLLIFGVLAFLGIYVLQTTAIANVRDVFKQVYLHLILATDLAPNIGLWWYFFIEMFDHFRNFFLLAFNVHLISYVAPLSIKYSDDPLFAITILSGILAVFKSYPTLGDAALYLSLLSLHPEIFPYLRYPTVTALLYSYSLLLLPLFHHLWLHAGSGNANFFYAITLVWALAGSSSILDAMWAWGRLAWEREREIAPVPAEEIGKKKRVVAQL